MKGKYWLIYYYIKYLKRWQKFSFDSKKYNYFASLYNKTFLNERIVEVPIFIDIIKNNTDKKILEIGNVLSHYYDFEHDVVDKYEKGNNVINEDILTYSPQKKYDLILSISTFEHVGFDETPKDPKKIIPTFENIKNLLNPKGSLVFSIPLGYNIYLDDLCINNQLGLDKILGMKRLSKLNKWVEAEPVTLKGIQFHKPFEYANAILLGYYEKR